MNKKYLILGIALLLAVGLTNMARANSFNDALNTLSNQLYWLRDRLTAQVQTIENPMGSHENSYTWIKELDDKAKKLGYCLRDSDCYIPIDPQGEWCWTSSPSPFFEKPLCDNSWKDIKNGPGPHVINKKYTYYDLYGKTTPPPKFVPDINSLPIPPPCETWVSTMPSIGSFVPIKCNKGTCEVDRTKTINSKKYVILKESGQCALKDLCKTDRKDVLITTWRQFVFDTLEDCNLHKEGKLTVAELRRQRDDLLKQLSTLQGKTTVPTLPNVNTVTELQAQIKQLLTEIAAIQASRSTTTTTKRTDSYACDKVAKKCILVDIKNSAYGWTYQSLWECEKACGIVTTTTTNRLKYLCDSVKKTCTLVGSSAHSWTRLYNTKEECEDACKGTTTTNTSPRWVCQEGLPGLPVDGEWYGQCISDPTNKYPHLKECSSADNRMLSGRDGIGMPLIAWYNTGCKTERPVVSDEMRRCNSNQDCGFAINNDIIPCTGSWQFGYGRSPHQVAINRSSQFEYNRLWNSYLKRNGRIELTVMCNNKENTKESKCVNNVCKLTDNNQPAPEPPQAVDQWYKLTEFQGCNLDDFSRNCYGTNAAKNSGNEAKYCMNQYLLSKKIIFTDLTVPTGGEPIEGAVTCMSCECGKPDIYIKAKTNFENELNKIGFTKSNGPSDPTTPTEPIKKKTTIDLSHQEFYYKEDKDTNKIKYAIISSNDKSVCGDNICSLKENYLYKLDLTKTCSIHADKVINFSHCPQDCKNATEQYTGAGISKEEFNALYLSCTNQSEKPKQPEKAKTIGIPQPAKPIAEMNEAEKNTYKMQLQTFLIQLLTQLLTLMKK